MTERETTVGALESQCVLLVDDNPANLAVLSETLAGQGLTLLAARSGEDALKIAGEARPALILLDINMPGIGGFETCRRLKSEPATAEAVVVFLSARDSTEDKVRGFELGAADYIAKPFDIDEVVARVHTHMESYRRQQQLSARTDTTGDTGPDRLRSLIKAGESERVEFKSTMRWNLKADSADKRIEGAWLKTVVAFLNTDGGALLIGVDDDGNALGIEPDQFDDADRYLLHANNLLRNAVGPDFTPFIDFGLEPLDGKQVLVVECRPSPRPAYLRHAGAEDFYVRIGPGSRKLSVSETVDYLHNREAAASEPESSAAAPPVDRNRTRGERILLVDDNAENLKVLYQTLDGRGHELLVARSGEQALQTAARAHPSLVLLDIMMPPGIDGYETCRRLRADDATGDIPIIFMSALDETSDKVRGFECGAVDYITKPFQADEVLARVGTHLTIQGLQRDLARRNDELHRANERMSNDLLAAARIQKALLPQTPPDCPQARFDFLYRPCDELAGDALSIFGFDDHHVGMYVLDVTGHGVPAALLSVAVTYNLMRRNSEHSIVTRPGGGSDAIIAPAEVMADLNRLFPMEGSAFRFFTMVYVVLDTRNGLLRYAAGGHAGPLVVRADGRREQHPSTGLPVGVDPDEVYEEHEIELGAGDRVFLCSDGAYEEMNADRVLFGLDRLYSILASGRGSLAETLTAVPKAIEAWTGATTLSDDLSLVAIEMVATDQ